MTIREKCILIIRTKSHEELASDAAECFATLRAARKVCPGVAKHAKTLTDSDPVPWEIGVDGTLCYGVIAQTFDGAEFRVYCITDEEAFVDAFVEVPR